jgi:deoxyribodipyrimidine photo-lyase
VYTPYRNAWRRRITDADLAAHPTRGARGTLASPSVKRAGVPTLAALGFDTCDAGDPEVQPGMRGGRRALRRFLAQIDGYAKTRDRPALPGTSRLSVHLRFGTVSIRELVRLARARAGAGSNGAATWEAELVWREFFSQLLWHHPRMVDEPFHREYRKLRWRRDDAGFDAWREGRTGYPLVDAAMRELAATGWMHNRLRMVTASFLAKDLLIDWRRGERWFGEVLLDYDLASNNGNWQWAASTGCDAQPWFRIFNPVTQSQRFDPDGAYIRIRLPELASLDAKEIHAPWLVARERLEAKGVRLGENYPRPVVEHAVARDRALEAYAAVKE